MFSAEEYALSRIKLAKWNIAPKSVRFVHLAGRSIFMRKFGDLLEKHFKPEEHLFLLLDANDHGEIRLSENMLPVEPKSLFSPGVSKILAGAQKIFIHSLWHPAITKVLLDNAEVLPRTDWIAWGADLFDYAVSQDTRRLVQGLHGVVAHTPFEWREVQKKFNCDIPWTGWGPFYDSGEMKDNLENLVLKESKPPYNVMIGHRAHPGLRHIEVFKKLKKAFGTQINIICPLSYGSPEYRDEVITAGKKLFASNFYPVLTFLPPQQFYKLLQRVDVGIFPQERTMCLGSITSLLNLGKKVFIRKNTVNDQFLGMLGADLADSDTIDGLALEDFVRNDARERNFHAMRRLKGGDIARQTWQRLLYDTPLPAVQAPLPKALSDYVDRPASLEGNAFWDQVRRTLRGQEFEPAQLEIIYREIRAALQLTKSDVLLDLACGNGRLASEFFNEIGSYHGVDLSAQLIKIANNNFASDVATFEESALESWLERTPDPQRYTKCLFYGAAAYFGVQELYHILYLLNRRFIHIGRVLVSPVPDIEKASKISWATSQDLSDQYSAIGMWHHRGDFVRMARDCGWQAEIRNLDPDSVQSYYKFSAILTRD